MGDAAGVTELEAFQANDGSTEHGWDAAAAVMTQPDAVTWQAASTMSETLDTGSFRAISLQRSTRRPPNLFLPGGSYLDVSDDGA